MDGFCKLLGPRRLHALPRHRPRAVPALAVPVVVAVAALLAVAAAPPVPPALAVRAGAAGSSAGTFPVTEQDDLGYTVTLARRPERIVSLAPSNTEILFAIGAGTQVVGVTRFDDTPPEVAALPRVGGVVAKSISVESIVALRPDLVLAAGSLQKPVIEALRSLNIPVFSVDSSSFEHLYQNIRKIGRLSGHVEAADRLVGLMAARVEAIRRKVADIPLSTRVRVFYEVWDQPLMTAGPHTFIGQIITLAGGINVFEDVSQDWPQVSPEELIRRNPDVILGPATHGTGLGLEKLKSRPGWQNIRAVQTGRVYTIEDNLISRPGPRLVQGLELVALALYPDRFSQKDASHGDLPAENRPGSK